MKYKKHAQKQEAIQVSNVKTVLQFEQNTKEREIPFFKFIFQKPQIIDLFIILGCSLLAYAGINYCYPYPLMFSDSYGYVEAAKQNVFFVYRPFGYSYFLKILHSITTNIHFIFIVQSFLLFLATSFVAFTVKYFYEPTKKWLWHIVLAFLIFCPTSFIMANWIMSDLLFAVLIYFIVALFIFITKRESWIAALLYVLVLFTTLHVRYSAILFPFVLIPFFLMKKGKLRWFIIPLSVVAFCVFYSQTKQSMKENLNIEQFSTGFDGWTYLNNNCYVLPHIDLQVTDFKSAKLKNLHNFIMEDLDIIENEIDRQPLIATNLMWNNKMPLKQYLFKIMQDQKTEYLTAFVKLGSGVYKDYAIHIMTHYPFSYLRYYYLPNCKQAFYPHPGCIIAKQDSLRSNVIYEYYNIDAENTMQAKYEVLSSPKYHSTVQILHLIMWIFIVGIGVIALFRRKQLVFSTDDKIVFWGLFSFAAIYYASSIFATPMEIRYVMSMHSIQFACCYILLNKFWGSQKEPMKIKTTEKQPEKPIWKKIFLPFKYAPIVCLVIIFVIFAFVFTFFKDPKNTKVRAEMQEMQIQTLENTNDPRMNDYIEACKLFQDVTDSVVVITRKPEIFQYYSGNKKAETFPYDADPDMILSFLKETRATHVILDDKYRYAYLTLYPAVQKYTEKFKVLKAIGMNDTSTVRKITYVLEFNDEWGYYGERVDEKKQAKDTN